MRHKGQLQVIETTRYAEVVRAFAAAFPNAVAQLDRKTPAGGISKWCTNANLKATNNFSLIHNGIEVLGFHDGPQNMWASDETLHLLNELAARKVLRLGRPAPKRVGLLQRLFGK